MSRSMLHLRFLFALYRALFAIYRALFAICRALFRIYRVYTGLFLSQENLVKEYAASQVAFQNAKVRLLFRISRSVFSM